MLLPEARLDTLLDQLRMLPAGDRKAVLAKLSRGERARLKTKLRGAPPARPTSPWSPDIAARIANNGAMTAAGRAALARAAAAHSPAASEAAGSLLDALAARFWPKSQ